MIFSCKMKCKEVAQAKWRNKCPPDPPTAQDARKRYWELRNGVKK